MKLLLEYNPTVLGAIVENFPLVRAVGVRGKEALKSKEKVRVGYQDGPGL